MCIMSPEAMLDPFASDMHALYFAPVDIAATGETINKLLGTMCERYPEYQEFYASSGYRLIPGDTCNSGLNMKE